MVLGVAALAGGATSAALAGGAGAATGAAAPRATATAACAGRTLLSCSEKDSIYNDGALTGLSYELEASLFELRLPVHLNNPALNRYWRFEVSAAGVLSLDDDLLINQLPDSNFQAIAKPVRLAVPAARASGIVKASVARALNAQMADEQAEVLNVNGMLASLDRATGASYVAGRGDWVSYQRQVAAGFARRAAAAVRRLIGVQRTVAGAFARLGLRFGIGIVDERLTRTKVRRHGLTSVITAGLRRLGVQPSGLTALRQEVAKGTVNETVNLAVLLDYPTTVSEERAFAAALSSFARTAPHGLSEPS